MNFLFVDASRKLWGTERALLELAAGCAQAGHRVLAVIRRDSEMAVAMRALPAIELHETCFKGGEDPRAFRLVLQLGRQARVDWLVAAHGKHHWPLWVAAKILGTRLAAFRHLTYIRSRFTRYWMPRLADRYCVVSEFARRRLVADGVPERCLRVVYNPIDCTRFCPDPQRRAILRDALAIEPDALLAGFAGRHEAAKGVPVLRRAMIEAMRDRPGLHMLWLGEGPELAATHAAIDAAGQAARHHFIAWRDDPEAVYPALDLLLCPSEIEETFGRVVAEAEACGVPVIARDRGALPEALCAGETGMLWPGDDADSLARLAGDLLDDAARRQVMAQAAPRWVRRFDTPVVVEAFVSLLGKGVQSGR